MSISGKYVILRAIEKDDLSLLQLWNNDSDIQHNLGGWHFPSSASIMEKWFDSLSGDELNQRYAIDIASHGLIGTTNLVNINWKDRNASCGIMIGDTTVREKGYGTDAVMTLMRYAFEELGFERLDTTIIAHNEASLNLYVGKCGWVEEGRKKNWYWRRNRYWDKVILGITKDLYFDLVSSNSYWS